MYMQKKASIAKLDIIESYLAFVLPFGYDPKKKNDLIETLLKNDYDYFKVKDPSEYSQLLWIRHYCRRERT